MTKALLRQAVSNIVTLQHPGRTLVGEEMSKWLESAGIHHATLNTRTGLAIGFGQDGLRAITNLTVKMRSDSLRFLRGITFSALADAITNKVIEQFGAPGAAPVSDEATVKFEADIAAWFEREAHSRQYFIACSIIPDRAPPFSIGPVTFVHANDFTGHSLGMQPDNAISQLTLDGLGRDMAVAGASWIAIVEIDGCHPSRSSELADLSVDVAIAAIQLAIPKNFSDRMARITARSFPAWRTNISRSGGQLHGGLHNTRPALGLPPAQFEYFIANAKATFSGAGTCLAAFISGSGVLPVLKQAWSDAAYWFHEALAEPLDTIATAKLETSVEVLLRAEKTSGSSTRMRKAFKATYGLTGKDPISPNSVVSVDQFIKSVVGARSQVLHGTYSTLMQELVAERNDLTAVVWRLLVKYAESIELYSAEASATDEIDEFLKWMESKRTVANGAPPGP